MMSNNDIRIDTISGMTGREVYMRMVHIPTGKTAEGSGVSRLRAANQRSGFERMKWGIWKTRLIHSSFSLSVIGKNSRYW